MTKTAHDSETLAEGDQVITVCGLIYKYNHGTYWAFLAKRAETKKFLPDVFELPGGHVDFGEELDTALKREIKEELQESVSVGACFAAFTYVNDIKKSHSAEIIYFASFDDSPEEIKLDPADHSDYAWVSLETLPGIYTTQKGEDDIEFKYLKYGLELLGSGVFSKSNLRYGTN